MFGIFTLLLFRSYYRKMSDPLPIPGPKNLKELLKRGSTEHGASAPGLIFYASGNNTPSSHMTYQALKDLAMENSRSILAIPEFNRGTVVVLYFDNHYENIVWFWSVVYAGGIPAPCPPFSKIDDQRRTQVEHLHDLLRGPIFLTARNLRGDFSTDADIHIVSVDDLKHRYVQISGTTPPNDWEPHNEDDTAVLMLTSGSTGKSKAVCLTNFQIMAAITGKSQVREIPPNTTFLSWVGFDHVASLTEIHLNALFIRATQVHVSATDVITNPELLLRLLSKHRVGRSFAPHFLLVQLVELLKNAPDDLSGIDLSVLKYLATGGEANTVVVGAELASLLSKYGAAKDAITPGFGMTETCAGAIYNTNFPNYDLVCGYEFASLGTCINGMRMRVTSGELQVSGDVVFSRYFNNPKDTAAAFTQDGWFKTGDQAILDSNGNLCLVGRSKETININGVKYSPHEIETGIKSAKVQGIAHDYLVCFAYRRNSMHTDNVCVVYAPSYHQDDMENRYATNKTIKTTVMLETGASAHVIPLSQSVMPKSTLGKFSRSQIKKDFEMGNFQDFEDTNNIALENHMEAMRVGPSSDTEKMLVREFAVALDMDPATIGVEIPLFDMGVTSITLIKLKRQIEAALEISNIPVITLMTNPTVRALACALSDLRLRESAANVNAMYNPVVVMQSAGTKLPLWLFHPGVGEVLVFLNLSKYMTDRPVYALRARGFEDEEPLFTNIDDAVQTYCAAIKQTQPIGPYALAGYSYGAMLAFESAKHLESKGDTVQFLGSFNLPPHIKMRMRKLIWSECLLHLAYFLDLITEEYSRSIADQISRMVRAEAVAFVFEVGNAERISDLGLTHALLEKWASLAFGLQSMARDYEPSGCVASIDVFCAEPLAAVAADKETWRREQLSQWKDFCASPPRIHDVDGSHYTMIDEDHVVSFQKRLRKAMDARII